MVEILYIKTSDGVILRFANPDALGAWVSSGRLPASGDTQWLDSDEQWKPITVLLERLGIDVPVRDKAGAFPGINDEFFNKSFGPGATEKPDENKWGTARRPVITGRFGAVGDKVDQASRKTRITAPMAAFDVPAKDRVEGGADSSSETVPVGGGLEIEDKIVDEAPSTARPDATEDSIEVEGASTPDVGRHDDDVRPESVATGPIQAPLEIDMSSEGTRDDESIEDGEEEQAGIEFGVAPAFVKTVGKARPKQVTSEDDDEIDDQMVRAASGGGSSGRLWVGLIILIVAAGVGYFVFDRVQDSEGTRGQIAGRLVETDLSRTENPVVEPSAAVVDTGRGSSGDDVAADDKASVDAHPGVAAADSAGSDESAVGTGPDDSGVAVVDTATASEKAKVEAADGDGEAKAAAAGSVTAKPASAGEAASQQRTAPAPEKKVSPAVEKPVKTTVEKQKAPEVVEKRKTPTEPARSQEAPVEERREPTPVVASRIAPDDYRGHVKAGNRALRNDPEQALVHYQVADSLKPGNCMILTKMGDASRVLKRLETARDFYERALRANPQYNPAVLGLARIHKARGKQDQARKYYQMYIEINGSGPGAPEARQFLGTR